MSRFALLLILVTFIGCGGPENLDPPDVLFGVDECIECRMIISDDRFAAAFVTRDEHDRIEKRMFDDIGCLLVHRKKSRQSVSLAEYVKDFETREWLSLDSACLVTSKELHSPMAFGVAACATVEAAESLLKKYEGRRITIVKLRSRPDATLPGEGQ